MSYSLGQTTASVLPAATPASSPPARPFGFADGVMWAGILGGFGVLFVGGVVGQHRLWTKEMKKNGLRHRRR